jgi:uncharacterized protein (DUF58 family)
MKIAGDFARNSARRPSLLRRLLAFLRPPRTLKMTPAGRTCLVVTLGVGLAALNTGNNLVYLVFGLLLSGIVVSGILSERCLRGLSARRIGTHAAFANESFPFRWAVSRTKGSSFALRISEAHSDLVGEGQIAYVPAGTEQVVRGHLVADRRGPRCLTGIRVSTSFPFGLFIKSRVYPFEAILLIYPARNQNSGAPPALAQHDPVGETLNPRRSGGTGDIIDLRELRPGEDSRRIHWRKSASTGTLLCVEREREERNRVTLTVDSSLPSERLESRCREVAAMAHRLLSDGHEVGLEAGDARLRPAQGPVHERRILDALAWVGFEESKV